MLFKTILSWLGYLFIQSLFVDKFIRHFNIFPKFLLFNNLDDFILANIIVTAAFIPISDIIFLDNV